MIDVSGKAGSLWAGSWAPLSKYGLCSILIGRHFLHASWDRSGIRCILSDRKGNIILINTKLNKWKFITQVTPAPCLIKFGLAREEFLVALPDCQVRCYSAQDGSLISVLGGHEKSVKQISLNGDGTRAITVSPDIAQIWNLSTFERMRKLDVKSKVELFSVEYLSDEHLLTIFKDNSIFIWKDEKCLGQIRGPEGVLVSSSNIIKGKTLNVSSFLRELFITNYLFIVLISAPQTARSESVQDLRKGPRSGRFWSVDP